MDAEGQEYLLGDLCTQITDGKHGDCENQDGSGFYFLSVKDVVGNRLVYENARQITERDFVDTHRRTNLEPGDILFTNTGTIGRMAFAPQDARTYRTTFQKSVAILKPKRELITPRFLYYLLKFENARLSELAAGTTQKNLLLTDLRTFKVRVPSGADQERIAGVLGAFDDKIELNRRINETLEAMARALFQSWFVDFDPVRAKAAGRPTGLPSRVDALFPSSFEEWELVEMPSGWSVVHLRELCGYLSRGIGPSYTEDGGICVLNQRCIRNRRVDFSQARRHDISKKTTDGRLIQVLDVLVNSTGVGTLGRVAQVLALPEPAVVDSHVTVLRAATGIDPWFFGTVLTSREADIEELGEGSTGQTELSRARLGEMMCVVPPRELQRHFGEQVKPLFERVSSSERASQTLRSLRDGLLPKLISGELRVTGAASVEENVA